MPDQKKAELLLQLLDAANFPGSQRHAVIELAAWLERIRDGRLTLAEREPQ